MIDFTERRLKMAAAIQAQSAIPYEFLAVPRDRGDEAWEKLSPIAFKIWYRVTRLTLGWGVEEAKISYSDFSKAAGLQDKHKLSAALKELVKLGFVRLIKGKSGAKSCYGFIESSVPSNTSQGQSGVHGYTASESKAVYPVTPSPVYPVTPVILRQPTPAQAPAVAYKEIENVGEVFCEKTSPTSRRKEKKEAPALRVESPLGGLSTRERVIQECGGMAAITSLHSQSEAYQSIIAALMATGDTAEEEEPTPLRHTPPVCNDERIMGAWVQVKQTIKTQMGEATYKGLIETAHPVGLKGNVFTLWTCSSLLLKRWAGLITEQLRKVLNDKTILVSFEAPAMGGAQ